MVSKEILELLSEMGYGEKPPEQLIGLINKFGKRMCAVYPVEMTKSDIVTCTVIYDLAKPKPKPKDKDAGGPQENG